VRPRSRIQRIPKAAGDRSREPDRLATISASAASGADAAPV